MRSMEKALEKKFSTISEEDITKAIATAKNFPGIISSLQSHPQGGLKKLESNTTVFAIKYKTGVLVAGDRRTSDGYYDIYSDETIKIDQVTDFSAVACCGSCGVTDQLVKSLQNLCSTWEAEYNKMLSPDSQRNYLSDFLKRYWSYFIWTGYFDIGLPVLAAYDMVQNRPRIFSFDATGFAIEEKKAVGDGCGYNCVKNLILYRWNKNLNEQAATSIACLAMLYSGWFSHGVSPAELYPPTLAKIDKHGVKWIEEQIVKDLIVKHANEIRRRQ